MAKAPKADNEPTPTALIDREGNLWRSFSGIWYRPEASGGYGACRGTLTMLDRDFGPLSRPQPRRPTMTEARTTENMALTPEEQIREVRRVIEALHSAHGSIHGPFADEIRHSVADWLEAALDGRLDPNDARKGYTPKPAPRPDRSAEEDARG